MEKKLYRVEVITSYITLWEVEASNQDEAELLAQQEEGDKIKDYSACDDGSVHSCTLANPTIKLNLDYNPDKMPLFSSVRDAQWWINTTYLIKGMPKVVLCTKGTDVEIASVEYPKSWSHTRKDNYYHAQMDSGCPILEGMKVGSIT